MGGTQLQHPHDAHSCEHQLLCDCSSAEKTLFQCIPHYPEILDQFLVQTQPERWLCSLKKAKIAITSFYCTRATPLSYLNNVWKIQCPATPGRLFLMKVIASHPCRPTAWTVGCICMLISWMCTHS